MRLSIELVTILFFFILINYYKNIQQQKYNQLQESPGGLV